MNKIIVFSIFLALSVSTALSQSRSRVFDNFDTSKGVQVVTSTVKPIVSSQSTAKNKTAKSAQSAKMNADEGMGLNKSYAARLVMGSSKNLQGFTTGDPVVDSYIVKSCERHDIDPLLIYAQMHQESAFKKRARSHKGASGLMQLMPATARRFGVTNIYDPAQNIDAGVKYMRWLLNKFNGDVVLALAGYNAGEGAVMKYGYQVPPYRETRNYVARITKRYGVISDSNSIRVAKKVTTTQAKKIEKKDKIPLTVYERNILAVKLPDGRMRLVSN